MIHHLRHYLKKNKIDGFYIPKHDAFFGEYTQPHDDIVQKLSGFSGSSGYAVITPSNAYLFVDGRYTLQAKLQTDPEIWTVLSSTEMPLFSFLNKNNVTTIALDPWCITAEQAEKITSQKIEITAINNDFYDAFWHDRPKNDYAPIKPHPLRYAGEDYKEKIKNVRKIIEQPLFVSDPCQICWLLNIRGNDVPYTPLIHARLIVPIAGPVKLFLHKEHGTLPDHFQRDVVVYPMADLPQHLMEYRRLTGKILPLATKFYTKVITGIDPIARLQAIKNPTEQDGFRKAHAMDAIAVQNAIQIIKEQKDNLTEMDVDRILLEQRQKFESFQGPSFPTIAGSGPNGAIIHYRATPSSNRKLKDRILLIDSGGQYLEGTTDVTRTIALSPPSFEEKQAYTQVLKGNIALSTMHFPKGTTGSMLDVLARQFLWKSGKNYEHGTGHGVGSFLNVHEGPHSISRYSNVPLEEGMIVSIEPGYYQENDFGIRIENLALIVPSPFDGFLTFETLTKIEYEPALILFDLLSDEEKDFILKT